MYFEGFEVRNYKGTTVHIHEILKFKNVNKHDLLNSQRVLMTSKKGQGFSF